jgi:hypothetical protein
MTALRDDSADAAGAPKAIVPRAGRMRRAEPWSIGSRGGLDTRRRRGRFEVRDHGHADTAGVSLVSSTATKDERPSGGLSIRSFRAASLENTRETRPGTAAAQPS